MSEKRKSFILDTSVLLYDKESIHSFPGSDVIIPLGVLDEVDRFKEKSGLIGEYARYVNRYLDSLRSLGNLHEGIEVENNQTVRVEINHCNNIPAGLDKNSADNRIIAVAHSLSKAIKEKIVVVTKDINFRVKCDALGISAEDYYKDHIIESRSKIYTGFEEITVQDTIVDKFYSEKKIQCTDIGEELFPNQFVIAKGASGSSFLARCNSDMTLTNVTYNLWNGLDISPRNKEQKFALDLLTRSDIPLVTMTGIAGSGKTFLTLMAALSGVNTKQYERIVITRSMQTVGRDIGYLPGTINDKMDPWISPIVDNFRLAMKDAGYFESMRDRGLIETAPLSFIRGRTFNNCFVIVDESQNSTIHELKTIITRIGEGSKIVLLGDIEQIDTPYIDSLSNGLTIVTEKFKNTPLAGHVTLIKGERSKIASLASTII
jgi:PhoH-like ATPase